jgi:hypothetical protein
VRRRPRLATATVLFGLSTLVAATTVASQAATAEPITSPTAVAKEPKATARSDFDNNGFDDLAIGAAFDQIGDQEAAGSVTVIMGGSNGLRSNGAQLWHQGVEGVFDVVESHDFFGTALAAGDVNGDGFSDLAIGVNGEDSPGDPDDTDPTNAGMVHVLFGSQQGLRTNGAEHIDGVNVEGELGTAVAMIDYFKETGSGRGADGFADLAFGAPGTNSGAGRVSVMNGTEDGLFGGDWSAIDTSEPQPAPGAFGSSLAVGNWGDNGLQNLAVGAPGAEKGGQLQAGKVFVFFEGIDFTQETIDVQDEAEPFDNFGMALAAGDFNGDGRDDLAVGAPGENIGTEDNAGLLTVLHGTSDGLTARNSEIFFQDQNLVPNTSEENDFFAASLESANLGRGPEDDLAIGVPLENLADTSDVGMVDVMYGSPGGLAPHTTQNWHQNVNGVNDSAGEDDLFGIALGTGRFGKGGASDLAIGVPVEDLPGEPNGGAVSVLYSRSSGLKALGDQLWNRSDPGIPGSSSPFDYFGITLYSSSDILTLII